jgi:hypothetical protein
VGRTCANKPFVLLEQVICALVLGSLSRMPVLDMLTPVAPAYLLISHVAISTSTQKPALCQTQVGVIVSKNRLLDDFLELC